LDDWANSATNGFVLFALGSAVKSENFPEEARKKFLEAFIEMRDIKFLWKWDNKSMPGLPSNVRLEKWLPQQDVLGSSCPYCVYSLHLLFI
jgi:glucuronosyltransferase